MQQFKLWLPQVFLTGNIVLQKATYSCADVTPHFSCDEITCCFGPKQDLNGWGRLRDKFYLLSYSEWEICGGQPMNACSRCIQCLCCTLYLWFCFVLTPETSQWLSSGMLHADCTVTIVTGEIRRCSVLSCANSTNVFMHHLVHVPLRLVLPR